MKKLLMFIMILLVSILTIGGCGMDITNPQVFDHIKECNGATMRCKVIDIGAWDMDAVGSVDIAHGLTFANIRIYDALIYVNGSGGSYRLCSDGGPAGAYGSMNADGTNIQVKRAAGGFFDDLPFNNAVQNRGHIFVWFID